MVDTWLRVISVDINKIKEQFELIDLAPVILQAVETVDNQAVRKDISLSTTIEDNLDQIQGESGTLQEALVNLLTNSIKYSHMGGKVEVKASQSEDQIEISVRDDGVGIAEEDQNRLFADFYRGKNLPEGERSSGVGLTITRRIIEAHSGSIAVNSELGEGSTFTIVLPRQNGTSTNS